MLQAGYKVCVAEQEEEPEKVLNYWKEWLQESTRPVPFTRKV